MTSVLKEYGLVAVSIFGALAFFFVFRYILFAQNESSIVKMMNSNVQYTGDDFGQSSRTNLGELQDKIPRMIFDEHKDYEVNNTYVKIWHTTDPEDKTKTIDAVPPIWTFATGFILEGVSVQQGTDVWVRKPTGSQKNIFDIIDITVIDYTPKLEQGGSNINSIRGKMAAPEQVIAVDRYGNKIMKDDGTYETTTRMTYEQRSGSTADSSKLGADEYYSSENNVYYGRVYFFRDGVWYEDKDNDGSYTEGVDTAITHNAVGSWTGIDFNTDIPHKFKVIYRVTDNSTDGNSLKTEFTKLFVAKPRDQHARSIDVWEEVYDKTESGDPAEPNGGLEEITTNTAEMEAYLGKPWQEIYDEAVDTKLAQLQAWQNAERTHEDDP